MISKEAVMPRNRNISERTNSVRLYFFIVCLIALALAGSVSATMAQTSSILPEAPGSFSQLAKDISPSVVNISVVKIVKGRQMAPSMPFGPDDPFRDFFDRFFGDQMPRDFKQRGLGTGFIIDKEGYILTNNHVVEKADEIKVRLDNEKEFSATVVGLDPKTDLALIKIKPGNTSIVPLPLGNSDKLEVGDWVVAIGNPFGLGNTVTAGIVSAKYRHIGSGPYDNFIQTDASINPGNSGGPLVNISGEVVGINSAIFSQTGGSIGIGFAIPINMAKDLLPQLKKGKVVRGWLGVMIQNISPELVEKLNLKDDKGALVGHVSEGGPAEKAGIARGDVIVSFDGKDVKNSSELPIMVASTPVGKTVDVDVIRKGKIKTFKVKIEELEGEQKPKEAGEARPTLGLTVAKITPEIARNLGLSETGGIVVVNVENDTPAQEAGVEQGDIILEVDQTQIKTVEQFNQKISAYKAGSTILLLVRRGDGTLYLTLKVW